LGYPEPRVGSGLLLQIVGADALLTQAADFD